MDKLGSESETREPLCGPGRTLFSYQRVVLANPWSKSKFVLSGVSESRIQIQNMKTTTTTTTTDTDENESDISSTLEREAPDGGWGWVVVGAAFFVNLIADGVTFSFGVFFTAFSDVFGASKGTTAWVGSLLAAMPLLSGPIASSLTDRFGCRNVTICGGLLASLGCVFSYYATSIHMLMLTFGVITGFGLSLCYVAAVVIVAYYFERKRSFATGLSVCGGGIGTFIFANVTQILIDDYKWRGTMLILAACFLSLCICGCLMKDLEWTKKSSKKRDKLLQNEHDFNTQAQQNLLTLTHGEHSLTEGNILMGLNHKSERLCNSALCIPTFVQEQERRNSRRIRYHSSQNGNALLPSYSGPDDEDEEEEDLENLKDDLNLNNSTTTKYKADKDKIQQNGIKDSNLINLNFVNNSNHTSPNSVKYNSNNEQSNNNIGVNEKEGGDEEDEEKQEAMKNYVVHHTRNWSGRHRHSLTYRGAVLSLKRYRLRPASSCPDIISVATTDDRNTPEWKAVLSDISLWMRGIFAWDNLSNTRFVLFIISNFLLYTWYDIPYIFLTDNAKDLGYTERQGAFLGSTIGMCNVFGNIILGYIGDKKWADSITVYGICISICGAAVALMPYFFTLNYYLLNVLCGIFGVMIAANYSLTPVILVKVVSLERFANAYGLLLLVQGMGNLIGPPFAGALYDWTGTWKWSFLLAGGGIFISNFFILCPIYNASGGIGDKSSSNGSSIDRDSQA